MNKTTSFKKLDLLELRRLNTIQKKEYIKAVLNNDNQTSQYITKMGNQLKSKKELSLESQKSKSS